MVIDDFIPTISHNEDNFYEVTLSLLLWLTTTDNLFSSTKIDYVSVVVSQLYFFMELSIVLYERCFTFFRLVLLFREVSIKF